MNRKVNSALISVTDKTGIVEFATFLSGQGVKLLSTGGTAKVLRENGLNVTDVSDVTGFPEIMDGRVKTLHPNVHGGLLGRRDLQSHMDAMNEHNIDPIDMVIVNLYAFEETVSKGGDFASCIENIDIGGPSMIRSAAKNHNDVVVITNPARYGDVKAEMEANSGSTSLDLRKSLAAEAFTRTGEYDTAISNWFNGQLSESRVQSLEKLKINAELKQELRYGENPHQTASLYVHDKKIPSVVNANQLQGKELSYNNIADTDAAFDLVNEFTDPAVAIIKHANPCGVATDANLAAAYERALACDPVSPFGGIFAFNRTLDSETAELLSKIFAEVIIAPELDEKAKEILSAKKNLRVLTTGAMPDRNRNERFVKSVSGGFLVQNRDNKILGDELKVVTKRAPSEQELKDLTFAFTVCKHVKSNAVVLAKDNTTVSIGAGQMNRLNSSRIAGWNAKETNTAIEDASGSVLASEAFFPFADGLIAAAENGITAVIQPGGSVRDQEVIDAANERDLAMVFTGIRHFRH